MVGFAANPNRINVSLTRARRCLIVLGDLATLSSNPTWKLLIDHIRRFGNDVDSQSLGFLTSQYPSFDVTKGRILTAILNLNLYVNKNIGGVIGANEGSRGKVIQL
jgi:hypothetical protein